nr:MAG TPA: hypothetical protein [Herelleviridae sp.]DAV56472.1 MAG TPA: hypothetical protein [Bacteriophage sp.]DAW36812.1 MAG TPA: hypothetical protein [Caudoviricetes sp.]
MSGDNTTIGGEYYSIVLSFRNLKGKWPFFFLLFPL